MRTTKSLCPECLAVIDATIIERNGQVILEKTCSEHGYFNDIYWSSAKQWERFDRFWHDGIGLSNPNVKSDGNCPFSCGICPSHKTTTILANIDVTNRCNMSCPVCFANSSTSGYLYEPSLSQIREMMNMLRNERPVPCPAVQLAGGEPTMREDVVEIVKMAKDFNFTQIQMATNGIKLSQSLKLCQDLNAAGLHTIYLQFDGVTDEPYRITRGYSALHQKLKAIENCRASGLNSVSLVPTLAKGVNDYQVGDIIRFAVKNVDTVKGINFQPISFTGRVNKKERFEKRITIPYLFKLIEEQTGGEITGNDFYPVPFVVPISHFVAVEEGLPNVEFTVHPHCGTGTYIYIEKDRMIPITRFIDVEGLLEHIDELALNGNKWIDRSLGIGKIKMIGNLISALPKFVDTSKAPKSIDVKQLFINVLKEGTGEATKEFHRHTLFIGAMHFMDLYNIDLERIKRCGVHYATPDGRIIPFCTYNTIHRAEVEAKFSIPLLKVRARS
ncbi:MAG: radical SAM protein [Candidatus Methanoperedens sp.]|nr:radical SAM protein [Candidatus Methanoperedens sp.]